jgi:Flp pilus assembly protein TadD
MKTLLLTACLSASLSVAACDSSAPNTPPRAAAAPKGNVRAPQKVAMAPAPVDAGTPAVPEDLLSLAHEHRGEVDHVGRARELKATGDFEGAVTESRKALFHDGADLEALAVITRVSELTGQRKLLVAALARAAELAPEDAEPLIRQARVLVGMGKTRDAIEVAQSALMRDGEDAEAYQVMGRAYLSRGDFPRAIELFKRTVELSPYHGFALNNLGFALLRTNENEDAVEVLTQAAEILPTVAYVHNNLGVALERVGRVEEAKLAFSTATSLSPKYVKARINANRLAKVVSAAPGEELEQPEPDLGGDPLP